MRPMTTRAVSHPAAVSPPSNGLPMRNARDEPGRLRLGLPVQDHCNRRLSRFFRDRIDEKALAVQGWHVLLPDVDSLNGEHTREKQRRRGARLDGVTVCRELDRNGHQAAVERDIEQFLAVAAASGPGLRRRWTSAIGLLALGTAGDRPRRDLIRPTGTRSTCRPARTARAVRRHSSGGPETVFPRHASAMPRCRSALFGSTLLYSRNCPSREKSDGFRNCPVVSSRSFASPACGRHLVEIEYAVPVRAEHDAGPIR